jgi:hypothetical protein
MRLPKNEFEEKAGHSFLSPLPSGFDYQGRSFNARNARSGHAIATEHGKRDILESKCSEGRAALTGL